MSRTGQTPVEIVSGVEITINGLDIQAKGAKGTLSTKISEQVNIEKKENQLIFTPANDSTEAKALWGTSRSLVNNIVIGVSTGFSKILELNGVGYRAAIKGKNLEMALGYSHPVIFDIPEGIEIKCPNQTTIEISGADKQSVGQVAADIRKWRKPEPYKGKGIKYSDEIVRRKEGKKK
jgi:large subunit ribosomal protein L6